ncbi:membrane-bound O-acyltransferase family MBOAT domain protein [Leptospira weilii str. Ecochallenge]|uniref:Membrane-bound O-acyltransferase family MBOAT domain protein n=1 Tax=Leptospira weilii str. Ecochallenge TaxID=1049986 RepID=N1U810_9LEPT|nr:membrane-bound O-acyltransferase family MBOAT domain protein [Leptospira weilii str. Ecochallenge]
MVLLLLVCISFNFAGGIWLGRSSKHRQKRIFVFLIVLNLGILIFFKYILFLLSVWNDTLGFLFSFSVLTFPEILLPVGISFYTFHNISYLSDIRSGKIRPCSNFIRFGVYDLFFPLLLAGPIERPDSLLPQIETERVASDDGFISGAVLFFGEFLKRYLSGIIFCCLPKRRWSLEFNFLRAWFFGLLSLLRFKSMPTLADIRMQLEGLRKYWVLDFP